MVRHSSLSPEHEALLQDLAKELRVGRVCGRAAGLYPATDLLVRYDLYGVSVAFCFAQEDVLRYGRLLVSGCEQCLTRAILSKLRDVSPRDDGIVNLGDSELVEAWNRSLHRGF